MSTDNTVDRDLTAVLLTQASDHVSHDYDAFDEARASGSYRIVWLVALALTAFLAWAWFFKVDEISSGTGKVIPSSREQIIQSLEGGILTQLRVAEGDIVERGQVLAQLDPTRSESNVEETAARYRAALASSIRLQAEVSGGKRLDFPDELKGYRSLLAAETALFQSRRTGLQESVAGLTQSLNLINNEIGITQALVRSGAASNVELLRLQRQRSDLQLKITETRAEYMVKAREELARANAEVQSLQSVIKGRADTLTRLTMRSPVRGVVKDLEVTTIGGVVPPNGNLMAIVPLDDQLLIEARISPRDIAFIHPGQRALVKVTAYDYAIYGGLEGEVVTIAPDTLRDEVKPDVFYYRVYIRTAQDALFDGNGNRNPIVPGMVSTVDVKTGSKTIWDYLIKPVNKAREAMRER